MIFNQKVVFMEERTSMLTLQILVRILVTYVPNEGLLQKFCTLL